MSRAHRAQHRRLQRALDASRHLLADDDNIGMLMGWCADSETLEEAKTGTHDALIALMGNRRTGGVEWKIYEPPAAFRVLDQIIADEHGRAQPFSQSLLAHYRKIRDLTRRHGGYVVIALAPGNVPEPPES